MSAWFKDDDAASQLAKDAIQIALNYFERSGEMDDYSEMREFLMTKVGFMIGQGQRNKLLMANRAIAAFQRYRAARTIELSQAG